MNAPPPERRELRISDADRERAVDRLNQAVAEGRLAIAEFEERLDAVLQARTASEIAPHLADLPGSGGQAAEVVLEVYAGSTTLILPRGASVDIEQVETGMVASSARVRKVPTATEPVGEPHVVVSGTQWAGTLTVRHQRRFLGARW